MSIDIFFSRQLEINNDIEEILLNIIQNIFYFYSFGSLLSSAINSNMSPIKYILRYIEKMQYPIKKYFPKFLMDKLSKDEEDIINNIPDINTKITAMGLKIVSLFYKDEIENFIPVIKTALLEFNINMNDFDVNDFDPKILYNNDTEKQEYLFDNQKIKKLTDNFCIEKYIHENDIRELFFSISLKTQNLAVLSCFYNNNNYPVSVFPINGAMSFFYNSVNIAKKLWLFNSIFTKIDKKINAYIDSQTNRSN